MYLFFLPRTDLFTVAITVICFEGRMMMIGVTMDLGSDWMPKTMKFPCKNLRMWGWEMCYNRLFRNFDIFVRYYPKVNSTFNENDFKIRLIMNLKRRELWFERNGISLGCAYKNLPKNTRLYPFSLSLGRPATLSIMYVNECSKRS